jgi:hypothetical protein
LGERSELELDPAPDYMHYVSVSLRNSIVGQQTVPISSKQGPLIPSLISFLGQPLSLLQLEEQGIIKNWKEDHSNSEGPKV